MCAQECCRRNPSAHITITWQWNQVKTLLCVIYMDSWMWTALIITFTGAILLVAMFWRLVLFTSTWIYLSVPAAPPVIEMEQSNRVILVRNQSLSLSCNTTNVNGEITLKWVIPPGSVRHLCFIFAIDTLDCLHFHSSFMSLRTEHLSAVFQSLCSNVQEWNNSFCMCIILAVCVFCGQYLWNGLCVIFVFACKCFCVSVSICLARIDMHSGLISGDLWALTGCRLVSTATSKGRWNFTYSDGELHSRTQCHAANSSSTARRCWKLQMWS